MCRIAGAMTHLRRKWPLRRMGTPASTRLALAVMLNATTNVGRAKGGGRARKLSSQLHSNQRERERMRFATAKELSPADSLRIDEIMEKTKNKNFTIRSLIREVILTESFRNS